jgi:outer membrane protein OmpA-like peptidoglycan-associated protein
MMMRSTLSILLLLAALTSGAGAQSIGIDPQTLRPGLRFRTDAGAADNFRRLPYQNLPGEIRIELAADTLYDFDKDEVRSSAADYIQQTANLIFEEAKGPVRIECRSDRLPTAVGQKLAARCANTIAQWLTVQEKLKVKFTTVGSSVPPAAPAPRADYPLAPQQKQNPNARPNVTIVFAKK